MNALEVWLMQATKGLSTGSAAKVRTEIQEHYELAHEAAIASGATAATADTQALHSLGSARDANCQYRRVLLTAAEAKVLRESESEARVVCSRPWLRRLIMVLPLVAIAAATSFFLLGRTPVATDLLFAALAISPFSAAVFLPISTAFRGRALRWAKWIITPTAITLMYGPKTVELSWLLLVCLWPLAWTEWTRASIRRKLPQTAWPRHLYL